MDVAGLWTSMFLAERQQWLDTEEEADMTELRELVQCFRLFLTLNGGEDAAQLMDKLTDIWKSVELSSLLEERLEGS